MILRGIFWDFLGKMLSQGFSFIASIFLARLLLPDDFGLVAIALVFINISQIFIDVGFGAALIQKKEVSAKLYSSVFWLNLASGLILTFLFYTLSYWIGKLYDLPQLATVLQFFSLAFIINSLGVIQRVQMIRQMNFKSLSIISGIATILSGTIAVLIAFYTKSYWALVVQQLSLFSFTTLLLWIFNKWRPHNHFSVKDLKSIWGFSSRVFFDGIFTNIINSADTILIGKIFPTYSLGLYNRAKSLSELVRSYSSSGITNVVFPAISKIQGQKENVVKLFHKMNASISVFSVGLAFILFLFSKPLILILYTAKWEGSILFFQILILSSFLHPINSISLNTLNGLGFIKTTFRIGLVKKAIRLTSFFIAIYLGLQYFAIFISISIFINFLLNAYAVKRKIGIHFSDQVKPIALNVLFAIISYLVTISLAFLIDINYYLLVNIQLVLSVSIYIGMQYYFNSTIFTYWTKKISAKISYVFQKK